MDFASFQYKYSPFLFLLIILIFGGALYTASNLQIDPSFSELVSKDSEYNTNARILENAFGVNDAVLLHITIDDSIENSRTTLQTADVDDYLDSLSLRLKDSQFVEAVSLPTYGAQGTEVQMTVQLFSPNKVGAFQTVLDELNTLIADAGSPVGVDVKVTGLPVLLNRVITLLISDNLTTIFITLTLIFAILWWYFKSIRMAVLTTLSPLMSLVFLAAFMVLLGIDVTITLAAVGVLTLGLGADYSIHVAIHYKHARQEGKSVKQALVQTINELGVPILASFLTTAGGFAALILGVSPSSQAQGIVLTIAIFVIYLVSIFVYPVLLALFTKNITFQQNTVFIYIRKLFAKLAIFQAHNAKAVIFIIVIITGVMMYGASQVAFSTSNSNWIPDDDPISVSFRETSYTFGSTDTITLVVESTKGDLRNIHTVQDIKKLVAAIKQIPTVDAVRTAYDNAPIAELEAFEYLTQNGQYNQDYTLTRIDIISANTGQDESGDSLLVAELRSLLKEMPVHATSISLYGDPIRFEELGDSLQADAATTTMIGFFVVFVIASIIYASLVVGLIAIVPVIIAIIWAVGLMGFFGVPFTSLSTGIVSLVLGIGVDFSIHLVDNIQKNLKRFSIDDSIEKALTTSGSAIFLSSLTTFFGFLALTFATLLGTQRLGFSLAFSILSVFIVSISLVPAIMALKNHKTHKARKRRKK